MRSIQFLGFGSLFATAAVAAAATALVACSSSSNGVSPVDGGVSPTTDGGGGSDGGGTGPSSTYPATKPAMPQVQKGALPVIAAPVVVPVYFSGETQQAALDSALSSWVGSATFKTAGAEYGVTSASAGASIVLTESAAATLTADAVDAWLAGKLNAADPAFGAVDKATLASKIFVLYYPQATSISIMGGASSCNGFSGYHAGTTLTSGAVATYVVMPRCAPNAPTTLVDALTQVTTALVISTAADPLTALPPATKPGSTGWAGFDAAHLAFSDLGNEVGTVCGLLPPATLPGGTTSITRTWSNAAAAAYHDPCRPAPTGAYYVTVPIAVDDVTTADGVTKGLSIPKGTSKTIELQLISDGPTTGAWDISTIAFSNVAFNATLDQNSGQNGEKRTLTVTAPASAGQGTIAIASSMNGVTRSVWALTVESK